MVFSGFCHKKTKAKVKFKKTITDISQSTIYYCEKNQSATKQRHSHKLRDTTKSDTTPYKSTTVSVFALRAPASQAAKTTEYIILNVHIYIIHQYLQE